MDLMKLAKGLDFDIDRMVKQRVGFKMSYNCVIAALNKKFVREVVARPGWWDTTVQLTGTCISICNDTEPGNMERSRNVSYWYLQNFKGRRIDNVRSSYLVRKIKDMNVPHNYHWIETWCNPEYPPWEFINYCEDHLMDIWYYPWEDRIYTIEHDLFIPPFDDTGENHLIMKAFNEDGMDRWRHCLV
jgi:hypothetical protein